MTSVRAVSRLAENNQGKVLPVVRHTNNEVFRMLQTNRGWRTTRYWRKAGCHLNRVPTRSAVEVLRPTTVANCILKCWVGTFHLRFYLVFGSDSWIIMLVNMDWFGVLELKYNTLIVKLLLIFFLWKRPSMFPPFSTPNLQLLKLTSNSDIHGELGGSETIVQSVYKHMETGSACQENEW